MNYQQQAEEMARKCAHGVLGLIVCEGYDTEERLQVESEIKKNIPLAELLEARDRLMQSIIDRQSLLDECNNLRQQNTALLEVAKAANRLCNASPDSVEEETALYQPLFMALNNLKQQGIEI